MNRKRADMVAGLLVAAVVAVGLLFTWDAYQRQQAFADMGGGMMDGGGMMGSMMGTTTDPLWYLLGTLIVGAVLGGGYLLLRPELQFDDGLTVPEQSPDTPVDDASGAESSIQDVQDGGADTEGEPAAESGNGPASILQVLPDDERRVLEPVIDEPGLTQIALRDKADFSKSKISQTVSELEKRGLLYREKQGRTYRVYPDDDLDA